MNMLEAAIVAAARRAGTRGRRPRLRASTVLVGLGLGASAMYLLDPRAGAQRRSLVRDKATHSMKRAGVVLGKGSRDLAHRSRGLLHDARGRLRSELAPDHVLVERARATMGHVSSHPGALEVRASDGCVTLFGPVLAREHRALVDAIGRIPGVTHVDDRLEIHLREDISSLQGMPSLRRARSARKRWSPLRRVAMNALGGGLAIYGALRRDAIGTALAVTGGAVVLRALTNRPLRRLVGPPQLAA